MKRERKLPRKLIRGGESKLGGDGIYVCNEVKRTDFEAEDVEKQSWSGGNIFKVTTLAEFLGKLDA